MTDFNELAKEIHRDNVKWWTDPKTKQRIHRDPEQLLMLIVSELSEAMEGERKDLMDDHLPHRKMAEVEMADSLIRVMDYCGANGIPIELSGRTARPLSDNRAAALFAIVRFIATVGNMVAFNADAKSIGHAMSGAVKLMYAYCEKFGYDLDGAMAEKRAYNAAREDHSFEARLAVGGKKW